MRWRCVPADGTKRHDFFAAMPLRHPTDNHPDGTECESCDKGYETWEGPRAGHEFTFTVQEIVGALLSVGQGHTLRETASLMRQGAYRPRTFTRHRKFIRGSYSREALTVSSYLDAFAPLVIDAHTPREWPEAVAIDSLPLRKRGLKHGEVVSLNAGEVMAAVDHSARPTRPILARVRGGKDAESWLDFMVSLTSQPAWVVADGGPEIEAAIDLAWPDAIFYRCDEHLRRNARKWALEDGIGKWRKTADAPADIVMVKEEESDAGVWPPKRRRYFELHPVYATILTCLGSPAQWARLKAVVEAEVPASKHRLRNWIRDNEALVLQQCQLRQRHPGMPTSTGQAEAFLEIVRSAFRGRAGRFTNIARLDKVLGLMVLNRAQLARRATYQGLVRAHFLAHHGRSAVRDWHRWFDERGAASLDRLMIEADFRTAAREVERQGHDRQDRLEAAIAADADARLAAGLPLRRGRKRRADETPRRTYFPTKGLMVADTEVGQQWHPTANGELDPRKVSASSTKVVMWLCREHEALGHLHEWPAPIVRRTSQHTGCPWHMNRRVCSGNSLRTTHPEIAAEWHPTLNPGITPDDVLSGMNAAVWWACLTDPAHPPFPQRIVSRTRQFAGCPACALDRRRGRRQAGDTASKRRKRALVRQARIAGLRPQDAASDPPLPFDDGDDQSNDEPIAPLLTPEEFAESSF